MATPLNITSGFYVSRVLPISHQRCMNCYPSKPTVPALSEEQLLFTPGIEGKTTTGDVLQANRGSWVKGGIGYVVNGTTLYRVDKTAELQDGKLTSVFSTTALGTVPGAGRVSIAANDTQLMVLVPGGKGYIYNEADVTPYQEITDPDFTANGQPQIVVFVDGYFLITTDEKKFIISSLNNGLAYNALDFASAESDPDAIVAPVVVNNLVYITGTKTTEGFQNLPSIGRAPFIRNNVILDKGCKAPFSLVKSNSTFFMVGAGEDESPAIWQFTGNGFTKKSSEAIDQLLTTYTESQIEDISAFSYSDGGAYFVVFNLPDTTLVFDVIMNKWHERGSMVSNKLEKWRVSSLITVYGTVLVGDLIDGRVGELSLKHTKEYDSTIIRLFTTQPFTNLGDEVVVNMLELTVESGAGNSEVPNPVMSLATSGDAKNFGFERVKPIGKKGKYGKRVAWYKNGRFDRFVVLQFRLSEPVKSAFIKLEYE